MVHKSWALLLCQNWCLLVVLQCRGARLLYWGRWTRPSTDSPSARAANLSSVARTSKLQFAGSLSLPNRTRVSQWSSNSTSKANRPAHQSEFLGSRWPTEREFSDIRRQAPYGRDCERVDSALLWSSALCWCKVTSNKESLRPLDLSISNASKERDKQR